MKSFSITGHSKDYCHRRRQLGATVRRWTTLILICAFLLPISVPVQAITFEGASYSTEPSLLSSVVYLGTEFLKSLWGKHEPHRAAQENPAMPGPGEATPRKQPQPPPSKAERKAKVATIALNPSGELTLQLEQPVNLAAIPLDKDGNTIQGTLCEWESSDPETVSITEDGQAVAKKLGTARLTVTSGNKRETIRVTVVEGNGKFGGKKPDSKRERKSSATSPMLSGINQSTKNAPIEALRLAHPVNSFPQPYYPVDADPLPDAETGSLYQSINRVGRPVGTAAPSAPPSPAAGSVELPGSGNFSFGVSLLNLPGRGLALSLGLIYNSRVWNRSTDQLGGVYMTYDVDNGWPAPGFKLGYGQMEDQGTAGFTLTDADGTRHQMKNTGTDHYESTDGTFISFDGGQGWGAVTYPDGTCVDYGAAGASARSYPTKITDRNGNYILINYVDPDGAGPLGQEGPKIASIKDTMSRWVIFHYADDELITITAPGYLDGADRQVVRFYYDNVPVNASGSNAFSAQVQPNFSGTSRVLKYVYFPGTRTGFRYEYFSVYGMMTNITRLMRMTVSTSDPNVAGTVTSDGQGAATTYYNYPATGQSLSDAPTFTSRTDDWMGRTTLSAPVYQYSVDQATGISTVTAPDGVVQETHTIVSPGMWNDGFVSDVILKTGSTVLSKVHTDWVASSNDMGAVNARVTQVKLTNDVGQTKTIEYEYTDYSLGSQNYNNLLKVKEYDLTTDGSTGAEVRRVETDYVTDSQYTGRGLKHLPTAQRVVVGGAVVSRTAYAYDQYEGTDPRPRSGMDMYASPGTNARGNVTSVTAYADAAASTGATTNTMKYDVAGNIISETVNCCNLKTFSYTSAYQFAYPETVSRGDAGQLTTSAAYDYNTGLLRSSTDENNQVTTEDYSLDTYPTWHMATRPDGGYSREIYFQEIIQDPDATHSHTTVYSETYLSGDPNAETSCYRTWQFMDGRGAVARSFTKTGLDRTAEGYSVTDVEYDAMGRVSRVSNPYYASLGAQQPIKADNYWTTVSQYDGLGRARVVTLQDGTTVQTGYTGQTTPFVGVVSTVTDQAGKSRRQVVDALGRLRRLVEPDADGILETANSPVTTYDYDGLDNLKKITQGEQVREFKYDSLGRLTHQRQVEAVATLNDNGVYVGGASGQWTAVTKYNVQGHIVDGYDARGVCTHFSYDGLNRVTGITYFKADGTPEGTPAVTYTYDQPRTGYYNKGRLTEVSTASASGVPQTAQALDYNRMGMVARQVQTVGANAYTLSYSYNLADQLTGETYPSGKVVTTGYDYALRVQSVTDASRTYLSGLTYGAHGGVLSGNLGNGAVESYSYNNRLQLSGISLTKQGVELQRYDYKYGQTDLSSGTVDETKNNGLVARIEGYIGGVKQWQQRFGYDSLGRLATAKEVRGDNSEQSWRVDYTFDRFGNRYQSANQASAVPYVPVASTDINTSTNRFTNQTTYDEAGNVTADDKFRSSQYRYDANNRMKQVLSGDGTVMQGSAVYDGLGQRVQATESGETRHLIYDAFGRMIAEYGTQMPVGDAGGVKYVLADHQGSTRVVMNSTGAVIARRDYQPFGEEIGTGVGQRTSSQSYGASEGSRQRYGDLERDKSGLDHADWRKYDSSNGRWTTADPYTGSMSLSNPQSFNRYSYVLNDPINLVDPSGLDPDDHELGHTIIDGGTVTVNGGPDLPDFSALPGFGRFDPFDVPLMLPVGEPLGGVPIVELNHPQNSDKDICKRLLQFEHAVMELFDKVSQAEGEMKEQGWRRDPTPNSDDWPIMFVGGVITALLFKDPRGAVVGIGISIVSKAIVMEFKNAHDASVASAKYIEAWKPFYEETQKMYKKMNVTTAEWKKWVEFRKNGGNCGGSGGSW